jgi:hypothetical protein
MVVGGFASGTVKMLPHWDNIEGVV